MCHTLTEYVCDGRVCIDTYSSLNILTYLMDLDHPTGGHGRKRLEVCKCTHIRNACVVILVHA